MAFRTNEKFHSFKWNSLVNHKNATVILHSQPLALFLSLTRKVFFFFAISVCILTQSVTAPTQYIHFQLCVRFFPSFIIYYKIKCKIITIEWRKKTLSVFDRCCSKESVIFFFFASTCRMACICARSLTALL